MDPKGPAPTTAVGAEKTGAPASESSAPGRFRRSQKVPPRFVAPVVRAYRKVHTKADSIEPARLGAAVVARRPLALSIGLLLFIIGFSVDDLRVLRWPGYLVGAGLLFVFVLLGPLTMGRGFALSRREEPLVDFQARAARSRLLAQLSLLVVALAFVGWLVIFSAGVPPWVR